MSRITQLAKYTYGSNKGGITQGQVIADPWAVHPRNDDNARYTSEAVVETIDSATSDYAPAWTPILKGAFVDESGERHDAKFIDDATSTTSYLDATDEGTFNITGAGRLAYRYDNVKIPQNDLPIVNVEMATIPLVAKARRVAINR